MDSAIAIDISSDSDDEIQEIRARPHHPPRSAEGYIFDLSIVICFVMRLDWVASFRNIDLGAMFNLSVSLRRDSSTLRPHQFSGSSSTAISHPKLGLTNPSSCNGFLSKPLADHRPHIVGNGHIGSSRIPNVSVGDYEKFSSQQALKRTHQQAFSRPPFPPRPENANSNGNASHFRGEAMSAAGNRSSIGIRYGGAHDEIGVGRVINGNRILPPSVVHGTSAYPSHYNGLSDPMHRNGIGEERNSENDERLIYQAALQDLNQPKSEIDLPAGLLSVPLMRHQKIALAWMFQKETNSLHCLGGILADDQGLGKTISTIALILKQMHEAKLKSKNSSNQEAEALDLDADDESENTFEKHESKASNGSGLNGSPDIKKAKREEASTSTQKFNRTRPAAGTLIVCPASVVRQWARELDEKVTDEAKLSVLIYHGGNRTKDPIELAKYDVVMTTYAIVTNEVPKQPLVEDDENDERNAEKYGLASGFSINKKRKNAVGTTKKSKKKGKKNADDSSLDPDSGTLAKVGWFRVVLDEAQTIKNHRTQVARACCGLRAKRRWCLSGTPIQNTIDDLYSYFRFLKYDPYAVYKSFCHTIKGPISRNSLHGYKKLQAVLRAIMLRRTKGTLLDGQPIINLPPKTINLSKVDFSEEERSFYIRLESDSRSQFKAYAAAGTLKQNYANILLMLLRLRQACDHPQLVKARNSDSVGKVSEEAVKRLSRETRVSLLSHLASSPICSVCHDPPEDPVVTLCGHIFCYQCVSEYITGDENTCPVSRCREQLALDVVFSESTLRSCHSDDSGCSSSQDKGLDKGFFQNSEFSSSKIKAVLNILQSLSNQGSSNSAQDGRISSSSQSYDDDDVTIVEQTSLHSTPSNRGPIKTIIFSQWTGMLDLLELSLIEYSIEFRRLDGTMSLIARDRAVKEFSNDPDVKVMIMSLKAGNLGLNMVAACHVILLDLWWNPTTEDQAIDRAHRIGQTRPVTVTRITIKDTVEDRILALQEDKRKMVASAFGEEHGGSSATRLTVDDLKYLFMV
ncbi:Helicase-like transcription factor CHR28 [Cardamine amara subsp. amara]|uniref:Helicase-like transcription factor CHR28 n=1 Tax=Cardamine amara subsp. amara TaxID=228776 RepID=A0ABD0ZF27_CARAN